jgi:hypothetical protein
MQQACGPALELLASGQNDELAYRTSGSDLHSKLLAAPLGQLWEFADYRACQPGWQIDQAVEDSFAQRLLWFAGQVG